MPFVGFPELIIVGVIALLVFGPKRLPEMGRSLGRGLREFKQSVTGDKDHLDLELPHELEPDEQPPLRRVESSGAGIR